MSVEQLWELHAASRYVGLRPPGDDDALLAVTTPAMQLEASQVLPANTY